LSRLDVATDFRDVLFPARYIRNLADAPHSGHGQRQGIWSGAHRSHGETLYWRNKGGKVRLYDKNVETRGRAPKGVLRFEVEARGKWCKRAGLRKVGDLCEERLTAYATQVGDERHGNAGASMPQWVKDLHDDDRISPAVRIAVIGYVVSRSYGREPAVARGTRARNHRIMKRHGIPALVTPLAEDDCPLRMRLDLESGQEVVYAAR